MSAMSLGFAAALAVGAVTALTLVIRSYREIPRLSSMEPARDGPGGAGAGPKVSIIVAARDEDRHVQAAVASLLAQDYLDTELVVVDDRSRDRTGAILDDLARKAPRLTVVHVRELPAGWLGKNHALHTGAQRATGDVLLFMDGDVMLERTAISRAVGALAAEGADHLTVSPQMDLPSWPLQLAALYFLTWGVIALRIWQVSNPRSRAFVGIGAFNMVRTRWYREVGGHTRIRMRPDDDLMLGKLLKQSGARQRVFFGRGMVSVEWYRSLGEATRGFRKNAFAVLRYSVALFVGSVVINLAIGVWPFAAVFLAEGAERALSVVTVLALLGGFARTAVAQRMPLWLTFLYPVAALLQTGMLVIAVSRTLAARGIDWRGTFYRLDELRANRV